MTQKICFDCFHKLFPDKPIRKVTLGRQCVVCKAQTDRTEQMIPVEAEDIPLVKQIAPVARRVLRRTQRHADRRIAVRVATLGAVPSACHWRQRAQTASRANMARIRRVRSASISCHLGRCSGEHRLTSRRHRGFETRAARQEMRQPDQRLRSREVPPGGGSRFSYKRDGSGVVLRDVAQMASSPRVTVTARPVRSTRPSRRCRSMRPPRADTWSPVKTVLPSLFDQ